VKSDQIAAALADITAETDATVKHLKLASLVSALFREHGVELVVVGGSAIEFYTEGAYVSGDIDLCVDDSAAKPDARLRQQLMGLLGGKGGPRSWQVGGLYVDLLGSLENLARTPLDELRGPYGPVFLVSPEDLLVERVLMSAYPIPDESSAMCARKLIAVAVTGQVEMDWLELRRLAARPEYAILPELEKLVGDVAHELGKPSPYDSQGPSH
jgi:hypothetical protein